MQKVKVTVFTATYNRRHTLPRVYESLESQSFRDFEWLIVDDGSTDGTGELIQELQSRTSFKIRYYYQENRGKHIASNKGVALAEGDFFLFIDSDDTCQPHALAALLGYWERIPIGERECYSTVTALCGDQSGQVIGNNFPANPYIPVTFFKQYVARKGGERFGINRTNILRAFPFPEFEGERFIPEGIVWNRISARYLTVFVNEILREYQPLEDGLSASIRDVRGRSPRGSSLYYRELSAYPIPITVKVAAIINYVRFAFHARQGLHAILQYPCTGLSFLAAPIGYFLYRADQTKFSAK